MVTNYLWSIFANVEIDCLQFLLSYTETKCTVVLQMHALIAALIALDGVKILKIASVVFELKWGRI